MNATHEDSEPRPADAWFVLVIPALLLWLDPGVFRSDTSFALLWRWRPWVYPAIAMAWWLWIVRWFWGGGPRGFWAGAFGGVGLCLLAVALPGVLVGALLMPLGLGTMALAPCLMAIPFLRVARAEWSLAGPRWGAACAVGLGTVLLVPAGAAAWCRADSMRALALLREGGADWRDSARYLVRWRWLAGADLLCAAYGSARHEEEKQRIVQVFAVVDGDEIEVALSRLE